MAEMMRSTAEIRKRGGGRVDREKLEVTTRADIVRYALEDGEDPDTLPPDWFPSAAKVRGRLGMTQPETADLLGIPIATWRNWEQDRTVPDPAARALLRVVWREPEAVLRAMRSVKS